MKNYWSKQKTTGYVTVAQKGRRRQLTPWRWSLVAILVVVVLALVAVVGVGKRGVAGLLSAQFTTQARILLVNRMTDGSLELGVASLDSDQLRTTWLSSFSDQIAPELNNQNVRSVVSQRLGMPLTGQFELNHLSGESWSKNLDAGFWSAIKLPSSDRQLYYRLWIASRDDSDLSLTATDPATIRQELKLTGLFTSYNRDCPVMIINTTATSGLGNRYAGMLEREGLRVVRLDSDSSQLSNSAVLFDQNMTSQCQKVADVIQSLFSGELAQAQTDLEQEYRVGIVVRLGQDGQFLTQ